MLEKQEQLGDLFSGAGTERHLERPGCPLCGDGASRKILEAMDDWNPQGPARGLKFEVRRCGACGACFTSPRFREELKHLPFLGQYPFYERARTDRALGESELQAFHSRASRLQQAHPKGGKLLDLGMGDGAFLKLMQRRGWSVAGIDNEPDVVAYARNHLKLEDCTSGDVERDPLPQGAYDVVTMWGVLQLVYRPQELLEKVRRVLAPGGIVGIGVSNFASAGARLFGSNWRGLGMPRHLIHFEPESLRQLMGRSGYEVLEMSFETPYWIAASSMNAALPLPGLLGRISRRGAAVILGFLGSSRLGDTLTAIARVSSGVQP